MTTAQHQHILKHPRITINNIVYEIHDIGGWYVRFRDVITQVSRFQSLETFNEHLIEHYPEIFI